MKDHYSARLSIIVVTILAGKLFAQEPETFDLGDFYLLGPVKTCVVKANYGEESFEFDRDGRLVKSLTRYNDADYDITYYRYADSLLAERRDEVYRNKVFDPQTSIAHFYKRDTAAQPYLVEQIVSYDKSFREQVAYYTGEDGRLERIVRNDAEGVNETVVAYSSYKDEETREYLRNGELYKSVRVSTRKTATGHERTELTKEFRGGEPQKATERTLDAAGRTLRQIEFNYDPEKKSFETVRTTNYTYDPRGFPLSEKAAGPDGAPVGTPKNYVYQMDGKEPGNWIRQIITPQNSFAVRQIEYFGPASEPARADSLRN